MKIAYTAISGDVAIAHSASKEQVELSMGPLSDDEFAAHILERSVPDGAANVMVFPENWSPPDSGIYRAAWQCVDGEVKIGMGRAKQIHRQMLRDRRAVLFSGLDVEFIRAQEDDDREALKRIAAQKKKLRDVTSHPLIDKAETINDLETLTLEKILED